MEFLARKITCSKCQGTRYMNVYKPHHAAEKDSCDQCHGTGLIVVIVPSDVSLQTYPGLNSIPFMQE